MHMYKPRSSYVRLAVHTSMHIHRHTSVCTYLTFTDLGFLIFTSPEKATSVYTSSLFHAPLHTNNPQVLN